MAKHPGGRPTKYTPALLRKAHAYVAGAYELEGEIIPTIEGLALFVGIYRATVYAWKDEDGKKEFSDIVRKCEMKQCSKLINSGLAGNYNASIAKLMLSKHDYIEKTKQDLTSGGKPLQNLITINGE